jgi:ABC-2 type transport system ATP-binding protein
MRAISIPDKRNSDMKLEVKNLTKKYGGKTAPNDFTMDFTLGVYGLLGPNGAGKTTLMSIITGNLAPDGGTVSHNRESVASMGDRFRDVLRYMPKQQNLCYQFSDLL